MHELEPHYSCRNLYIASEDERSPFFEREYSEFEFTNRIYNFLIHPQWDDFGSETLFMKILYAGYDTGFCIIELLGEWNDAIGNDIMLLKREIADHLMEEGIYRFIIIGENVLNFHSSEDSYYEEWYEDINENDGWIAFLNFREHVIREFQQSNVDYYVLFGGNLNEIGWRTYHPNELYEKISNLIQKRIGA